MANWKKFRIKFFQTVDENSIGARSLIEGQKQVSPTISPNFWLEELFILQYVKGDHKRLWQFYQSWGEITTNLEDLYYPISSLTIKAAAVICAILVSAYVGGS